MSALLSYYRANTLEAGCDEAGRGCLAGPVVAAAVILPPGFTHPLLNDSKKMTEKHRDMLRVIIENESLSWAVGMASAEEIDQVNILSATFLAMNRAVNQLKTRPALLLIDGNRFRSQTDIEHVCIVSGDALYTSVAAASVLAKTHRDEIMLKLHQDYSGYAWNRNKGYPTVEHKKAIALYGNTPYHRLSFRAALQTKINFSSL